MPTAKLHLVSPEPLADYLRSGRLSQALKDLAGLADLELAVAHPEELTGGVAEPSGAQHATPIHYRGTPAGRIVADQAADQARSAQATDAMSTLLEHLLDREMAVGDLADALMTGYEELNLLYKFLPTIATKVHPTDVGNALVAEAAGILGCRRVSLMVLEDEQQTYRVLAAHGLPDSVLGASVPASDSVAARALSEGGLVVVGDMGDRPDLAELSRGQYDTDSFAVVRVPLEAHGQAIGCLTATDRIDGAEFTARDHKLLEGLSAMGASALLNCRLHTAVNRQMISTIHALASAVDAKDHYTHDHAGRVARLCVATARQLGITDSTACREMELSGLMHDIGKIGIPDTILCKPTELSPEEFKRIQAHVHIGARIVGHVPGLEGVAKAILHHHERYDGLGYPSGLAGSKIPLTSAIIAAVDAFDALTSDRPYRKACSVADALRELDRSKGTQLDPLVVDAFVEVVKRERNRPTGEEGELDDLITPQPALNVR
jgi:HD-GYP domain-containing protein (c-di-GMP phosphodiesterase class II)